MKTGAVIAEFNPFHSGHKYIIDKIKENCDAVICIMSGNFVQRGECAVFDKAQRTRAALLGGVDLVIELPCVYALSSAEGFALGAVDTLNKTGIVDCLYFGSECGDIEKLKSVSDALGNESEDFKALLSQKLREGLSFPAARALALNSFLPDASVLDSPNNTLAVEYIKRLRKTSSSIQPVTVKRKESNYNDIVPGKNFSSATALRSLLKSGKSIDLYTDGFPYSDPVFMDNFDVMIASRVKTVTKAELLNIPDCNEEIASRIKDASFYNTFSEISEAVFCKSYTQSRIRRVLCNLLISNTFSSLPDPSYIRVLGFNKMGSALLSKMKSTSSLQIVTRGALLKNNDVFLLESRSSDIYNLARNINGAKDFSFVPVMPHGAF